MPKNINLDLLSRFYDNLKSLFNNKVDKETGKSLSTNDFTTAEKEKLEGIETGANKTVVDSALSSTSTNPVQNKVINTALGKKASSADVYDKAASDSRFLGINATAVKATADGTGANIADNFAGTKSDIAVNKTTLGVWCKNLFDWKNAAYSISFRLTQTKTESGISVTSTDAWAITAYKLPILEVGTNYMFSATISNFSAQDDNVYIMISASTSSNDGVKNARITSNGTATIKFKATSNTMYVLFIPNYTDTVYTNSFTASDIMLRYADIQDATYEPYKPSLQEQIDALTARISALEGT